MTITTTGRPSLPVRVTNFENETDDLYRNDGNSYNFTEVSYASGIGLSVLPWVKWGTAFVDLDNDGWLDLITANGLCTYPQVDQIPGDSGYRECLHNYTSTKKDGAFCDASRGERSCTPGETRLPRSLP